LFSALTEGKWERLLLNIKTKVDPENVFKNEQSVTNWVQMCVRVTAVDDGDDEYAYHLWPRS